MARVPALPPFVIREARVRIAYLDCFSGISGDMTLGALVDAGVDPGAIQGAVAGLGLPAELTFETVSRRGFRATHARVTAPVEHVHRHLHHIEKIIAAAALEPAAAELARRIFRRLGEAEARSHGIPIEKVHFHEVGAVDSIVDIVGSAVGFTLLGVDRVCSRAVPTGSGWVQGAHGRMPVPAPATAELLKGIPVESTTITMELTTPTGAAIVASLATQFGPMPPMTIQAIGLGAGTRDLEAQPNVLRLFVGEATSALGADQVWVLETNLDDLPGEVVGYTTARLLEAGALDVFLTPVLMKKNRPGQVVTVLCDEPRIPELEAILFRETTTLGIRRYSVQRRKLERAAAQVETPLGTVQGKLGWLPGQEPAFSPEFDACARIARAQGIPLREVYRAAAEAATAGRIARLAAPNSAAEVPDAAPVQPSHPHDHDHDHDHPHPHHHPHPGHEHGHDHGTPHPH
jgi:uncharacterized protein (TIGR00299 family) protein